MSRRSYTSRQNSLKKNVWPLSTRHTFSTKPRVPYLNPAAIKKPYTGPLTSALANGNYSDPLLPNPILPKKIYPKNSRWGPSRKNTPPPGLNFKNLMNIKTKLLQLEDNIIPNEPDRAYGRNHVNYASNSNNIYRNKNTQNEARLRQTQRKRAKLFKMHQ